MHRLSIFFSSPGDVGEERETARRVVARIGARWRHAATVEGVFWEHEPLLATADFQSQIPDPASSDIVVCVLWSRLGTRLPPNLVRPDGTRYESGTAYEIERATAGRRQRGTPDLLVYRKTRAVVATLNDVVEAKSRIAQKEALDAFIDRWARNPADGSLVAAIHSFDAAAEFEELLDRHLSKLVEQHLERCGVRVVGDEVPAAPDWTHGSPFRGLGAFRFEDAPVFFGRTRAVGDAIEALRRNLALGRGTLLVLGASGVGKSSLVQAGVLPILTQPSVLEGVSVWRRAVLRPGEESGDPVLALASSIVRPEALPEIGLTGSQIAEELRGDPASVNRLIERGLGRIEGRENLGRDSRRAAKLALVVDQLEELFAICTDRRSISSFAGAVAALATSGRAIVILTLRSDFYGRLAELPALRELLTGLAHHDVAPPTPAEIRQMIVRPAAAAGLRFEVVCGRRLDEVLLDAAVRETNVLPLLEFTLDELYVHRESGVLTLAAYDGLGGLEGALLGKAEEAFLGSPAEAQARFGSLMRKMVTLSGPGDETPTRREVAQPELETDVVLRPLLDRLVSARLVTADRRGDGTPTLRLAHEALLNRWSRVSSWLHRDRELLRVRARLAQAAARWETSGRQRDLLLPRGRPLVEAQALAAEADFELDEQVREFVRESQRADVKRRRRAHTAIASLVALGVAVCVAALVAVDRANVAETARAGERQRFEEARAATHRARAAGLVNAARDARRSDPELGLILALAASKVDASCDVQQALHDGLVESRLRRRWTGAFRSDGGGASGTTDRAIVPVRQVEWSSDGRRVATRYADGVVTVRRLDGGDETKLAIDADSLLGALAWSPDGTRVATLAPGNDSRRRWARRVCIWDAEGNSVASVGVDEIGERLAWSPDGQKLAQISGDGFRIWSREGAPISAKRFSFEDSTFNPMPQGLAASLPWAPDSRRLALRRGAFDVAVFDLEGKELSVLARSGAKAGMVVKGVAWAPEGDRIAVSHDDGVVAVWDASGTKQWEISFVGSWGPMLAWSPRGGALAAASRNGDREGDHSVQVYDRDGALYSVLQGHEDRLESVAWCPWSSRIATSSRDGSARVWTAAGEQIAVLRGSSPLNHVSWAPEGSRLVSGCEDGSVAIWSLHDEEWPGYVGPPRTRWTGELAQGLTTASVSMGSLSVFDVDRRQLTRIPAPNRGTLDMAWSPGAGHLLLSSDGELVVLGRDGTSISRVGSGAEGPRRLAWSPDGEMFAASSVKSDGSRQEQSVVSIWTVGGAEVASWVAHAESLNRIVWSPDGGRLATTSDDRTCCVWRRNGDRLLTLRHPSDVVAVAWNHAGSRLATGTMAGTAHIWDEDGRQVAAVGGHQLGVWSCVWSPDDSRFVTTSDDSRAPIWSASGELLATLDGHEAQVNCVAWSPDGTKVATSSDDRTVRVWKGTGEACLVLRGHTDVVHAIEWSPDGSVLASHSPDGTVRRWATRVSDLQELATARLREGRRSLSEREYRRYVDLLRDD